MPISSQLCPSLGRWHLLAGPWFPQCNMEADIRAISEVPSRPGSQWFHTFCSQESVCLPEWGRAGDVYFSLSRGPSVWKDKVELRGPCVCLVVKATGRHLAVFKNLEP